MKVILKRDEFNELNKEYEVHHIEQDKYGNKKIYLNQHRWVAPSLIEKYIEGENVKTTIIKILNQIANGEEPPKKIMYRGLEYMLADDYEYYCVEEDKGLFEDLFSDLKTDDILNKEVEILETTITYNQEEKITLEDFKNLGYSLSKIKDKFQEGWEEAEKEDNKIAKFNYTLTGSEIEKIKKDILNLGIKVNEIIDYITRGN